MKSSGGRVSLDTTAYAHFRRGHQPMVNRLAVVDEVLLSTVVVGELLGGFAAGSRRRENEVMLELFLAEDFVRVVEIGVEAARLYGELFAVLKAKGRPIPTNDLWIAAATMVEGATLLTFDSDFDRITGLRVERQRA